MKKNGKKDSKKILIEIVKKNWKMFSIIGVLAIAIIIAIATVPPKKTETPKKPLEAEEVKEVNYKGSYTKSNGELKTIKFYNGKKVKINDCVFSNLDLTYSTVHSSFSGKFISYNDKITGTVRIEFFLYDKDKKIVKSFSNDLKDVKKGEERVVLAEYYEKIDNVDSLSIRIQK